MLKEGVVEGNDIMVYMNTSSSGSAPEWKPTLHATSHSVDYSAETKVRKTKDTGKWSKKMVTGNSCTIKVDALRSYDDGVGYSELLKKMKAGEEVLLKYALKDESVGDEYEEGNFIISALNESSPAGEDATYSCTFENSGEVVTKKSITQLSVEDEEIGD